MSKDSGQLRWQKGTCWVCFNIMPPTPGYDQNKASYHSLFLSLFLARHHLYLFQFCLCPLKKAAIFNILAKLNSVTHIIPNLGIG